LRDAIVAHALEGQGAVRRRIRDELHLALLERPTLRCPLRAFGGDDHRRIVDPRAAPLDLQLIERSRRRVQLSYLIDATELTGEREVVAHRTAAKLVLLDQIVALRGGHRDDLAETKVEQRGEDSPGEDRK